MDCLNFPFDSETILRKKLSIKRKLLADNTPRIPKKIAVLGGVTTNEIVSILELFLLNYGIEPSFYESEYNQYYQEGMFDNSKLLAFAPDIIYVCTSWHNIELFPKVSDSMETASKLALEEFGRFKGLWESLRNRYGCEIIQNNFELPGYRLLGNQDAYHPGGKVRYVNCLNSLFAEYAGDKSYFHLLDLQYLQADFGIAKWSDPSYYHMYKYPCTIEAIPNWSFNLANIVKSLCGKNKKGLVLDLDNTLWGGVVGDVGPEGLEIGRETGLGQAYLAFQKYVKELKQIGVVLAVNSKNDLENAYAGLDHPEGVLKREDFLKIVANWEPKSENFKQIASDINLTPESLVFIDDNPAEREIVTDRIPGVLAPAISHVEQYPYILDRSGFFETTCLSEEDTARNAMYQANAQREEVKKSVASYEDYLLALQMKAKIHSFEPVYIARIAQLTNKSNQFNLTTRRCSEEDIKTFMESEQYVTLYCKLEDKFGDNGLISVVVGKIEEEGTQKTLHLKLWLMSCRVLKRDVEFAIMDVLVRICKDKGIAKIYGYYFKSPKNAMVQDFYGKQGFEKIDTQGEDTTWQLDTASYEDKNHVICVDES